MCIRDSRRVVGLARLDQRLVDGGVGIARVVRALIGAEDFISVVVRVEGAAPADEAGHLAAPVHLRGDLHGAVDTDRADLLRLSLIHI